MITKANLKKILYYLHAEILFLQQVIALIRRRIKQMICFSVFSLLLAGCIHSMTDVGQLSKVQQEDDQISLTQKAQWSQYEVNDIVWSENGTQFAVAGSLTAEEFGITSYSVSSPKHLWFAKTYVPFSLDYLLNERSLIVPRFAGYNLLDISTGESLESFLYQDNVCFGSQDIRILPNDRMITLGVYSDIKVTRLYDWDMKNKECLGVLIEENGISYTFEISQDNQILVLMLDGVRTENEYKQEIHAWNIKDREVLCEYSATNPFAISADGSFIASGSAVENENVEIWTPGACEPIGMIDTNRQPLSLDISPDGKWLVIGANSTIQLWDLPNQKLLYETEISVNDTSIIRFSPDGKHIISVRNRVTLDDQAQIVLWEIVS